MSIGYSSASAIIALLGLIPLGSVAADTRTESAANGQPAGVLFGLEQVAERARQLADEAFEDTEGRIPDWLLELGYDQWHDIQFRSENALWRTKDFAEALPFRVELFHPGFIYTRPVTVNVVDDTGVYPVEFSSTMFDYGKNEFTEEVPDDLGFAGLRILHPIRSETHYDEIVSYLGATYFRGVGREQRFGLSGRGLAIDTALPSGEEFPHFRELWLVKPSAGAESLTLFALLDSPSLTGAYEFVITPGTQTRVRTQARLFRREEVRKLGIAPLTSMFFFGENTTRTFGDFRPEVHDSDGLLVARANGSWLWRPLDNPRRLRVTGFPVNGLVGFGLLQRDREFDHYQDLEARYEQRASAWISPRGTWGPGQVELVEIPVDSEYHDNIVAYWLPEQVPPLDEPVSFSYDMYWYGAHAGLTPLASVVATRREGKPRDGAERFVIDFEGDPLDALDDTAEVGAVVSVDADDGEPRELEHQVYRNEVTGGWRLAFRVPESERAHPLRALLLWQGRAVSETWHLTPDAGEQE